MKYYFLIGLLQAAYFTFDVVIDGEWRSEVLDMFPGVSASGIILVWLLAMVIAITAWPLVLVQILFTERK